MQEAVVGCYLTEVWAECNSFSEELPSRTYTLANQYDTQENKDGQRLDKEDTRNGTHSE